MRTIAIHDILKKLAALVAFSLLTVFNLYAVEDYVQEHRTVKQAVVKKVSTSAPLVAITFDDGPDPNTTPKILNILEQKHAKATFFILGKKGEAYPELIQQMHERGHELGNHAFTHERLTRLSPDGVRSELNHTAALITNITGRAPTIVRPPDNGYNNDIVNIASELGYIFLLWSIDTRDWTNLPAKTIVQKVEHAKPGDIILLHDGVKPSNTVEALPSLIDMLQSKGYQLVTISELLSHAKSP